MGKVIKFLLTAILCLFLLGMVIGFIERFSGVLITIGVIVGVLVLIGMITPDPSSQPGPEAKQEPPKRAEDDKIEKLHVDMED